MLTTSDSRPADPLGGDAPRRDTHGLLAVGLPGVLWVLTYLAVRIALKEIAAGDATRVAIAVIPILPFLLFLRAWIRGLRGADELERKVQLEALAFAFPVALILLMVLGLVELAIPLSKDDWSYRHVWSFLPLLYFVGLAIAWRRYR